MRNGRKQRLEYLSRVPLFAGCSLSELRAIDELASELPVHAGRELMREGDPGRETMVILSGEASVSRRGRRVARLGAGDVVGELAVLGAGSRTATVTADTEMTVLVLDPREFRSMLERIPRLALKVARTLAERVEALEEDARPARTPARKKPAAARR